jgi:uncharacterized protein YecT (DUF1311 family)
MVSVRGGFLLKTLVILTVTQIKNAHGDEQCTGMENEYLIRSCLDKQYTDSEHGIAESIARITQGADTQHKTYFDNFQTAWVRYRNAECDFEGDAYRGGTLQADQATLCTISKNKGRVDELENDVGLAAH